MFTNVPSSSPAKEKVINENFLVQEAINRGIIDRTLSAPPALLRSDGLYIPAANATGAWENKENQLMWWNPSGIWREINPTSGMVFPLQQEDYQVQYDGVNGIWKPLRQIFENVADMTAFNAINNMKFNDLAQVLDADGAGNEGWFIYTDEWKQI